MGERRCRLQEEHQAARALLARVEAGTASLADLSEHMSDHMAFEENDIIPLLAEHLPRDTGPVRTLLEDHVVLRDLLRAATSTGVGVGDSVSRLRTLLLAHFEKEEELILPFAHDHFCSEELGRIGCASVVDAPARPAEGDS